MESIFAGLSALRTSKPIIVVDAMTRENEGDLVASAALATPALVNFLVTAGRGLVCAPLSTQRAQELQLRHIPHVGHSDMAHRCNFADSVDAASGISTGISTADRAHTLNLLASPRTKPSALVRPGHIFPLIAAPGGLLERQGHTEATVELLRMAGLPPVGVICEILNPDGTMARGKDLHVFAQHHGLPIIYIEELVRLQTTHLALPNVA